MNNTQLGLLIQGTRFGYQVLAKYNPGIIDWQGSLGDIRGTISFNSLPCGSTLFLFEQYEKSIGFSLIRIIKDRNQNGSLRYGNGYYSISVFTNRRTLLNPTSISSGLITLANLFQEQYCETDIKSSDQYVRGGRITMSSDMLSYLDNFEVSPTRNLNPYSTSHSNGCLFVPGLELPYSNSVEEVFEEILESGYMKYKQILTIDSKHMGRVGSNFPEIHRDMIAQPASKIDQQSTIADPQPPPTSNTSPPQQKTVRNNGTSKSSDKLLKRSNHKRIIRVVVVVGMCLVVAVLAFSLGKFMGGSETETETLGPASQRQSSDSEMEELMEKIKENFESQDFNYQYTDTLVLRYKRLKPTSQTGYDNRIAAHKDSINTILYAYLDACKDIYEADKALKEKNFITETECKERYHKLGLIHGGKGGDLDDKYSLLKEQERHEAVDSIRKQFLILCPD